MNQDPPAPDHPSSAPATTRSFASTIMGDFVARIVKIVARILNPGLIGNSLKLACVVGHFAMLAGAALTLVFTIVMAIRTNSFGVFLAGLGFVATLAVAQFAASRFLGAADDLIGTTPSRLSSMAFLECAGLLAVLAAAGTLVMSIVASIQAGTIVPLIPGLLVGMFWAFVGAIALHPELASVESGQGSAGEEAIGLLAFCLKAVLKIVPLFFALLACVGALVLAVSIVAPNSHFTHSLSMAIPSLPLPGMDSPGFAGAGTVLAAGLLPLLAYFGFLVSSLPLELWRAVLSLPGKIDALRR